MKLPVPAPQLADLVGSGQISLERLLDLGIGPEIAGVYEHWDHLRHLTPPEGLTPEAWWAAIKLSRIGLGRGPPLHDKHGETLAVSSNGNMQRKLHYLDREAAGAIPSSGMVDDDSTRKRYLMRSLIEEAMTSSQLECASTTRQIAKEMLGTGRKPRDRSEQMIFNPYPMMPSLRRLQDRPLSVATKLGRASRRERVGPYG